MSLQYPPSLGSGHMLSKCTSRHELIMKLQILTAVLNRVYNFSNPNNLGYLFWYVGEGATAIIIANIPHCWPLAQHILQVGPWTQKQPRTAHGVYDCRQPRTGRLQHEAITIESGFWPQSDDDTIDRIDQAEGWSTNSKEQMVSRS